MIPERMRQQLHFLCEVDKLKSVLRVCHLIDNSRRENTAEHSWHFALSLEMLAEHAHEKFDRERAIKIALIHDIVEIDAGDTYCYDESGHDDKEERERAAADRIFGLLPEDQGQELWAMWEEFEAGVTPEAKFARAIDRLNPFMLNYYSGGEPWRKNGIRRSQALKRMGEIEHNVPKLWPYVMELIDSAVAKGWLKDE